MKIEKATQADLPAIAALWHVGWHQGHADVVPEALVASRVLAEFTARVAPRLTQTFVMRTADEVAGFYMLDGDEVYQFYVDAAFQGRGVSGKLMASAEAALAGRIAWLACSVGNNRAAGFYEKAGWVRVGEVDYRVETASGGQNVTVWRYEKDLR